MANVDAFNSGFDLGMGKKGKKGSADKKSAKPVKQITTSDGQKITPSEPLKSFHKGGKVKNTGPARLKKGEVVLTVAQAKDRGAKNRKRKAGTKKRVAAKR